MGERTTERTFSFSERLIGEPDEMSIVGFDNETHKFTVEFIHHERSVSDILVDARAMLADVATGALDEYPSLHRPSREDAFRMSRLVTEIDHTINSLEDSDGS